MRRVIVLILLVAGGAAVGLAVALTSNSSVPGLGPDQHFQLHVGGDVYPYAVYVPPRSRRERGMPLVVVLHGCNETPDQLRAASRYDALAQQHRFVVLYPDVDPLDKANGGCWKGIWDPIGETRDRGDAGAIARMTRAVIARLHIDRTRVYAIGISAGAFETSILGADYPDLYAAIGVHSGAPFSRGERACLMAHHSRAATDALAKAALAEMGPRARVMPVIVFHGDKDITVPYRCGRQTVAQWLRTDDMALRLEHRPALSSAPRISHAAVSGGHPYTIASYLEGPGCPAAELWTIHGMGHYWSGGSADPANAAYSDPKGPSATAGSWAFFSRWRLSGRTARCARAGN